MPISDIDPLTLEAELEALNRYRHNEDNFSSDDEARVDELGYDSLLAARALLKYQQQVVIQEEDVPKIGLNEDDADTRVATSPVGALVSIGLAPVLMLLPSISSARIKGFSADNSVVLRTKRLYNLIPSIELLLTVQCQTIGISRTDYDYLCLILDIVASEPIVSKLLQNLLNTLDTLKAYMKGSLPFINLRSKQVKLNPLVQPTRNIKDLAELFFFDLIDFFKAYLLSRVNVEKLYRGLSHLVDVPKELWHSNTQHASIRSSSSVFALYQTGPELYAEDKSVSLARGKQSAKKAEESTIKEKTKRFLGSKGGPIFLSDIINFKCNTAACPCYILENTELEDGLGQHFGQVLAVAEDYRSVRGAGINEGNIIIKIREILLFKNIPLPLLPINLGPEQNEQFLNDKAIFVLVQSVQPAKVGVLIHYAFQATYKPEALPKGNPLRFIRRILKVVTDKLGNVYINASSLRPIQQEDPIRGELELNHFGRKQLIAKFCYKDTGIEVISVLLLFYIDVFGLYRNMYRALIGVYLFVARLTNKERSRRANIIPLTLGLYGCNLAEVIDTISAIVAALDTGIEMELVDSTRIIVYAPILAFLGNMLQQQLNASFLSQKARFGCRSCIRDSKSQANLDIKLGELRYYYDIIRTRIYLETYTFRSVKAKYNFAQNTGKSIKPNIRLLERIALSLDLKVGTPVNAAYTKMQGLAKRIYLLLKDAILTNTAIREYHFMLTTFLLLASQQVLQSPYYYIGLYTLQEYGRQAQIIPVLTRVQLKDEYLKPRIADSLRYTMLDIIQFLETTTTTRLVLASVVIVVILSRIAYSQRSLIGYQLTVQQYKTMQEDALLARRFF